MEKKLTDKQARVVELMKSGYNLYSFLGIRAANHIFFLQKGERGHGGDSENVDGRTAEGLLKRGIIKCTKRVYDRRDYKLTAL